METQERYSIPKPSTKRKEVQQAWKHKCGYIPNRIDIEERPSIVDLKQRFGDLEIDTVIGSNHKGALVTINDRLTSKVWIRKLSGKDATPLALKTIEALQPIKDLIHTITADMEKNLQNIRK